MVELLIPGDPVFAKYLNNRPMTINGIATFSDQTPPNGSRFYFTLMQTGATNTIRNIYLWVYGKQMGHSAIRLHGESESGGHVHTPGGSWSYITGNGGAHGHSNIGVDLTDVPRSVQIWIDGTDRTTAIGNPNSKSHYTGSSWGDTTSTEWDTGKLDVTSYIDLTIQDHYIEFKETNGNGGKLLFNLYLV